MRLCWGSPCASSDRRSVGLFVPVTLFSVQSDSVPAETRHYARRASFIHLCVFHGHFLIFFCSLGEMVCVLSHDNNEKISDKQSENKWELFVSFETLFRNLLKWIELGENIWGGLFFLSRFASRIICCVYMVHWENWQNVTVVALDQEQRWGGPGR